MFEWLDIFRLAIGAEFAGKPTVATLATVDELGQPDARTVVIREIADDGTLVTTSDDRSTKNHQITAKPEVTIVVWMPRLKRQFRFKGGVEIWGAADPRSKRIWATLPPPTRATFLWPAPGGPIARDIDDYPRAFESHDPVKTFTTLSLTPMQVEELDVSVHPFLRRFWRADEQWQEHAVSP
jgi:hypothetical protein